MEFNALVWAKAQDGQWHRGTVISREEIGDHRHIKVRVCAACVGSVCVRFALIVRCCRFFSKKCAFFFFFFLHENIFVPPSSIFGIILACP